MQFSYTSSVFMRSFAALSLSLFLTVGCSDAETAAPKNPTDGADTAGSNSSDASNCQPGDTNDSGNDASTDGAGNDSGTDTNTDNGNTGTNCEPDTDSGDSGSTDSGTDNTDDNTSDCDRNGFSTASHQASYGNNAFQYEALNSTGSPRDVLMLTSYQSGFDGPTTPGTYSLEGTNYADCGLCLLALTGCVEGGACEKYFYADAGSVTITEFGQDGAVFAGELDSVVFKEVTIDSESYVSTPVAGGETWCMNGHSFSVTVGQEPAAPNTGDNGDTGNTDNSNDGDNTGTGDGTDTNPGGDDTDTTSPGTGVPVLGNGNHTTSGVTLTVVAGTAQGLSVPRDIAFHPQRPEELWVMNWGDSSGSVLFKANSAAVWMCSEAYYGTYDGCDQGCGIVDPDCQNGSQQVYNNCSQGHEPDPTDSTRCYMPGGQDAASSVFPRYHKRLANSPNDMDYSTNLHFFAKPAAIAFGANGNFTSAQEEDGFTQPDTPYDFMGPTMWSSQLNLFNSGHSSHLDMLHNSPNSVGVAWETDNVYWIYDGYHGSLTRYNFNQDHGPGGTDHTDGVVYRYADGELGYEEGVPSHLVYENGMLYAADTANNRIVALNTQTGSMGSNIEPNYDGTVQKMVNNANLSTLISGNNVAGMSKPSGLEIHNDMFFVSDNATSRIFAFNRQGQLLDWIDLDLPAGSIMGMAFDNAGMLYVVDANAEQILQLAPK